MDAYTQVIFSAQPIEDGPAETVNYDGGGGYCVVV